MSRFFVGQRVRVARLPPTGGRAPNALGGAVGDEGYVTGTVSNPNPGFFADKGRDLSVKLDRHPISGMAPSYCFEPIVPKGHQPAEESIEEILPFLFEKERTPA